MNLFLILMTFYSSVCFSTFDLMKNIEEDMFFNSKYEVEAENQYIYFGFNTSVKYYKPDNGSYNFSLINQTYYFNTGLKIDDFRIGFFHYCTHPLITYNNLEENINYEGANRGVYINYNFRDFLNFEVGYNNFVFRYDNFENQVENEGFYVLLNLNLNYEFLFLNAEAGYKFFENDCYYIKYEAGIKYQALQIGYKSFYRSDNEVFKQNIKDDGFEMGIFVKINYDFNVSF